MNAPARRPPASRRAGNTIVEVLFAGVLSALLAGSLGLLANSTADSYRTVSATSALETEGARVMNRVVDALREASLGTVWPTPAGNVASNEINFRAFEDDGGGNVVLGNLQRIRFVAGTGQVVWTTEVGTADERSIVWTSSVPDLLEGEEANVADDNGNDLWDEPGLCFTTNGNLVVVRLTVRTAMSDGEILSKTFEGRVFCRT